MEDLVILDLREQEYLLRAIESAMHVRKRRQFFLWTQGQFQGLLPHEIMVCIQFGSGDQVLHVECLNGVMLDPVALDLLCNPTDGLAVRVANHCRAEERLPCVISANGHAATHPLSRFRAELDSRKLGHAMVHATERLLGGSSFFALFTLPKAPDVRQTFFFELLLPHLHLALLRLLSSIDAEGAAITRDSPRPVTNRGIDILRWVKEGKSNYEIGMILGISELTVKSHLQKIYKKLNVQNRVQAVSRCIALRLLD
ncbi:transcriptional regulator EpsA [Actimicrobium sp. GrIS 1.19]|uniref:XrtB/PEP-CTERM-associated transcriptional regulator EpsA n=1 Tax=Actimicrobium sp. GrIS 1.19 TaxID=3071708 RepID=UPI002E0086F7|nr:transcriptional regulator EpsA [Actimicrobium sp. GrIS 1.19]